MAFILVVTPIIPQVEGNTMFITKLQTPNKYKYK